MAARSGLACPASRRHFNREGGPMATMQLRPMAMGEILDASFALLRRHAGVFFGVAIVCQGLPTGLSLYVQFNGGAPQHFGLYVASQLLSFIGYLLVTGASIRAVSQAYPGTEPSLSHALDFGFGVIAGLAAALLPVLFVPALIGVGLIFLFFYPFTSCVFTLLYYDLRVRKEAFDLELLSQHLGITAARA